MLEGMNEPEAARSGSARSRLPARFGWSAVSNFATTGVMLAVALITTPILTRHLGPEQFGIWVLVGATLAYVELLDLGFGGAVVSAVARVSAADDDDELDRTLNSAFFLLLGLGVLALVIAALAALVLPAVMNLSGSLERTAQELLLLLGFDMAMSIPMDTFGCGLVALQRYDLLNATLVVVIICQAVAWTIVLANGGGLLALGIVTVAISLVGQGSRYVLLRRLIPSFSLSAARVDRAHVRALASPARWFAVGDAIEAFRDYTSVLVLGAVTNVSTAGIFAVGDKMAALGTSAGAPVAAPLFPHAAALVGRGETDVLGPAARTASRLITGITFPSCLVVAVLARPALVAWVGPTYEPATDAVVILAIAFGLRSVVTAAGKFVSGSGGQRLNALTSLGEVTTQVVLTAILGSMFGITGVAYAILAAVVCVELAVTLPLLARRLETPTMQFVTPVLRTHVPSLVDRGRGGLVRGREPGPRFRQLARAVRGHVRRRDRGGGHRRSVRVGVARPGSRPHRSAGCDRLAPQSSRRTRPRDRSGGCGTRARRVSAPSRRRCRGGRERKRSATVKVAVVVPVRNGRSMVRECVAACLAQTRPPDELLVVDNGSRDGTGELAARGRCNRRA